MFDSNKDANLTFDEFTIATSAKDSRDQYHKAFFATTDGAVITVCPDWAIYWTLGNFLKPLATINLSKSPTFLSNFCKGVKI